MKDIVIREVMPEELSLCAGLIRTAFLTVADEFGITAQNAPRFTAFATTVERLQWHMHEEHRPMFVCMSGDAMAGYYSLALLENGECELNNLCVQPEHRHGGIGQTLLEHAFEQAKSMGCMAMNIGIVEENRRLRAWYERFGFVHTGTEKFDFFPFTCGYMRKKL